IKSAEVLFYPPQRVGAWWFLTSEERTKEGGIFVQDIARSVFYVGFNRKDLPSLVPQTQREPSIPFPVSLYFSGTFQFDQSKALDMSWAIYEDYHKRFKEKPLPAQIIVLRFPSSGTEPDAWE